MPASRNRRKPVRRTKRRKSSDNTPAPAAPAPSSSPRPRVKLPEAMRAAGLDEHSLAQCLAKHITQLQSKNPPRLPRKLLLDYLKECVRILYAPARRGDAAEQPTTVELVHFVPRPDRSNDKPPGENNS